MSRRFVVVLTFLVIALAAPTTTLASDPDGNPFNSNTLAGRPICGTAANNVAGCDQLDETACLGVAYAAVDGKMALLTAAHCRPYPQGYVCGVTCWLTGPNGSVIGFWGDNYGSMFSDDLAVIWLFQGNWPTARNRVYRGTYTGDNWWTVTSNPASALGCSNMGSGVPWGRTTYDNWVYQWTDTTTFRTGTITGFLNVPDANGRCTVKTDLLYHGACCIDSGSPFVLCCNAQGFTSTVFGVTSGRTVPGDYLFVTPLYQGIVDLNNYMVTYGSTHTGAWLCQTSDCGGIGGY